MCRLLAGRSFWSCLPFALSSSPLVRAHTQFLMSFNSRALRHNRIHENFVVFLVRRGYVFGVFVYKFPAKWLATYIHDPYVYDVSVELSSARNLVRRRSQLFFFHFVVQFPDEQNTICHRTKYEIRNIHWESETERKTKWERAREGETIYPSTALYLPKKKKSNQININELLIPICFASICPFFTYIFFSVSFSLWRSSLDCRLVVHRFALNIVLSFRAHEGIFLIRLYVCL